MGDQAIGDDAERGRPAPRPPDKSVVVSVLPHRGGVAGAVSDDGVGLGEDYTRGDGLGLAAMSERVARVGGTVTIGPTDDDGVTVQAWVPA